MAFKKIVCIVRYVVICALAAIMVGEPAYANGQFGPESDILGFKLSMSQNQAKNYAKTNFKGRPFAILPVNIATNDYKKDSVAGFLLEVKSCHSSDPVLIQDGVERVQILFNPNNNSSDIFAIFRYINFGVNSRITIATLIDSLVEKYGQPTSVTNSGKQYSWYTWAENLAQYNKNACTPNMGPFYPYFYEQLNANSTVSNSVDITRREFVNYVNGTPNPNKTALRGKCGEMLIINIRAGLGADSVYAYEMRESLIDFSKGVSELISFRDDFFPKTTNREIKEYYMI